MTLDLDDDDTTPTGNATVLRELAGVVLPLGVAAWGAATSPGTRRRVNEDTWGRRGDVFVVADGMGGRGGGALAARTAVDRFLERVAGSARPEWRAIVEQVNGDVLRAAADQGIDRVGTTLLAAAIGGPLVTVVHIGDCRAYRLTVITRALIADELLTSPPSSPPPLRSGAHPPRVPAGDHERLDLLTHDHNVRAELLAAGLDVGEYRERGVALHGLTSFIGLEHDILRIDVLAVPVRPGDRLLLCSDGVHHQLDDDRLRALLASGTARHAAEALVGESDRVGGRDNSTAVVIEVGTIDPEGS
jgi:PPM family protein phosphatase